MKRSIRRKGAVALAGAVAVLGVSAGAAPASNINSFHSCGSTAGGISNASYNTPAGDHANSIVVGYYGYICGL
jgi:hypothetical protein